MYTNLPGHFLMQVVLQHSIFHNINKALKIVLTNNTQYTFPYLNMHLS